MLEAVGLLTRDRRAVLARQEVALEQAVDDRIELADVSGQVGDGALPEDPPDHRGTLQEPLLVAGQSIDARGDDRLQRVGDALRSALEQHPRGLLDEEWVALGLLQQRAPLGQRELMICEQGVEELLALLGRERLQLDGGGAQATPAPARTDVEQLRASETDDQQRCVLDALGEVLDQLEQRILGPVDVLEDRGSGAVRRPARRPTRAPPTRSPAGCAPPRCPRARRPPVRAGPRPRRRRSRHGASPRPRGPGRRP